MLWNGQSPPLIAGSQNPQHATHSIIFSTPCLLHMQVTTEGVCRVYLCRVYLHMPKTLSNTRDHDTSKTLQFSPSHQLAVPTCACTMQTSVCLLRVITLVLFILCVSHCTGTAHTVIFYVIINTREIFNVSLNTREELNCSHLLAKKCGGYYCSIFV